MDGPAIILDDDDVATTPTTGTTATATPTTPSEPPKVEPPKAKATPEDPLAKSKALKIITDTFAGVKKGLVEGDVQVLPLAEFKAAYDKIYGAGPYSWDKYVKPKFGDLEGFAYNNVNYINKDNAGTNIGTVVHEMLHNNTADDWRASLDAAGAKRALDLIQRKKGHLGDHLLVQSLVSRWAELEPKAAADYAATMRNGHVVLALYASVQTWAA